MDVEVGLGVIAGEDDAEWDGERSCDFLLGNNFRKKALAALALDFLGGGVLVLVLVMMENSA